MSKPEQLARQKTDGALRAAGWAVQDYAALNLGAVRGIAVREFPLGHGFGSTGVETRFTNRLDPEPRSRAMFHFHRASMAFISGQTNRHLSAKPPAEYFPKIIEQHGPQALVSQSIPSEPALHDVAQFREFLAARRAALARMMNEHLQRAREA